MEKIGIFFGSKSGNTRLIAELILLKLSGHPAEMFDIFDTEPEILKSFKNIIFGVPTWEKYELHDDWKIFLEKIKKFDLKGKKIAIYGLGDQIIFNNAFANGIGHLYRALKDTGCEFIGEWPAKGYHFNSSNACYNDIFFGLVIDEDNQSELTEKRVSLWTKKILSKFNE